MELDLHSLKRFWEFSEDGGELRFVLDGDLDADSLTAEMLNELSAEVVQRMHGQSPANHTRAQEWLLTTEGWAGVVIGGRSLDEAVEWLDLFAAALGRARSGRVRGGPRHRTWPGSDASFLPTAYLAYTTADLAKLARDDRMRCWSVDPVTTRYLMEQTIEWCRRPGGQFHLGRGADWTVQPRGFDFAAAASEALNHRILVTVACFETSPLRAALSAFWTMGLAVYRSAGAGLSWQERVDRLRATLLWSPPRTDLAMIRPGPGNSIAWSESTIPWPHVTRSDVREARPLLASFVPDASGVQLLTRAHLDRATDLSNWVSTKLPGDRFLLEARDLEPWFASALPDPHAVDTARSDFGAMLLTPEAIVEHNPWADGVFDHGRWVPRE
jgi:hypothetical protein